jgi:hypothetical protein
MCLHVHLDPQIFTVEGSKHIGIYAKRRIEVGEELNYDYKVGGCVVMAIPVSSTRPVRGHACYTCIPVCYI